MKFEHRPVCKVCGSAHFAKDPHVFPDKVAKVALDSPRPIVPGLMSKKLAKLTLDALVRNEARKLQAQVDAMVGPKPKIKGRGRHKAEGHPAGKRAGEKAAKAP